jgi:glycosyltransferase involved in cell wall biosynthesis
MIRSFLHRHVWQSLPREFRRRLVLGLTKAVAPKLSPGVQGGPPYIVVGALRSTTGLGQSARLCHDALKAAGLPVYTIDLTKALFQQSDHGNFTSEDGTQLQGNGTLIVHVNAPLMPMALLRLGRRTVNQRHVIGYWAWELEAVPPDWRVAVDCVHEVWAPSRFTARAIAPLIAPATCRVVPHPVALNAPPSLKADRKSDGPFQVLTILDATSSLARKNPLAAIKAFRQAFSGEPDVRLVLKISGLALAGEAGILLRQEIAASKNIVLLEDSLAPAELGMLFSESDVLLSLHRSEGFGLTLAEAMLHGLPVIATCWSGETDFLSPATAALIDHTLIPARDPQGTYDFPDQCWADADVTQAAAALRRLRDDRSLRQRMGRASRAMALELWSGERYLDATHLPGSRNAERAP